MHPLIKRRMVHPAKFFRYINQDGAGDSIFADSEDIKGFLWSTQALVRTIKGDTITSQRQFIVDFDHYNISPKDLASELEIDGIRVPILSIGTYEPIKGDKYELGVLYI